jgi:hypothetical protein
VLDPRERSLLFEALKPPPEYELDYAIGTTYSLDLIALLTTPLAFAFLDRTNREGQVVSDPATLLSAIRRYAGRICIFAQAGEVKVPTAHAGLLSFLESCVVEVSPAGNGVFHPKVWALRFTREDAPARYRLICASRNLTFDRCWDSVLVLEGDVADRKNAFAANHPLAAFFEALPGLATHSSRARSDQLKGEIATFGRDLRRVHFDFPEDFDELEFVPLGIDGYRRLPFEESAYDKLLVVSPFVSQRGLDDLHASVTKRGELQLVSRAEELALVKAETLKRCTRVMAFRDSQPEETETAAETPTEKQGSQELAGLHAKLYVADHGWDSSVWCGSANATAAAFGANVEFLIRLVGKKSKVGVDKFLNGEEGQASFSAFLEPFHPEDPSDEALAERALEKLASDLARKVATAPWAAAASVTDQSHQLSLSLQEPLQLPSDVLIAVKAWPISCAEGAAGRTLSVGSAGTTATFESLPMSSLTCFFAFCVDVSLGDRAAPSQRFVIRVPVSGMPANRDAALVAALLSNADDFSRYVMLLAEGTAGTAATGSEFVLGGDESKQAPSKGEGVPEGLMEALVRALCHRPETLDEIARTVHDLKDAGVAGDRLPKGWDELWGPIAQARKELIDAQ